MPADHIEDKAPPQKESKRPAWQPLLAGFKNHINRFWAWIRSLRIPIFIKLTALSTLLIFVVISTISFSMLSKQKKQFTGQLVSLGESMVSIAASNAPDKL